MRLDKFISQATGSSRTQARALIRQGMVKVDGQVLSNPSLHVDQQAAITIDGQPLQLQGARYVMLFKPIGVVSATRDSEHPTALDLLGETGLGLHIAGRLDLDTSGLLLLTDDGDWSHRLTAPRHHQAKTYLVDTAEDISADCPQRFAEGLALRSEKHLLRPAELHIIENRRARLTISEGRYHQVKRMFAAVGNHVTGLHRERIGDIVLDSHLAAGEWRPLTAEEIASVP